MFPLLIIYIVDSHMSFRFNDDEKKLTIVLKQEEEEKIVIQNN